MSRSKVLVPEAREALNRFKMEAANEVGVTLNQGYNGDKTSRENGSVGNGNSSSTTCQNQRRSFRFACAWRGYYGYLRLRANTHARSDR